MSRTPKIAPSVLAADYLDLGAQLRAIEQGGAERVHVDIMDGSFVPNLSLGLPILEAIRRGTRLPVEAHLMVWSPETWVERFAKAGSDRIIVHQEATPHVHRAVHAVRDLGREVSVAINPGTPAGAVEEILPDVHGVLVMTVNPGYGGQKFIPSTLPKIRTLRSWIDQRGLRCEIEVDGGVDEATAPACFAAGVDVLVAGSSVFGHSRGAAEGVRAIVGACCGATAAAAH